MKQHRQKWNHEAVANLKELIEKYVNPIKHDSDEIDVGCPHHYNLKRSDTLKVKLSWVSGETILTIGNKDERTCVEQLKNTLDIMDRFRENGFYTKLNEDFYTNLNLFGRHMFMHIAKINQQWDLIDRTKPFIKRGELLKDCPRIINQQSAEKSIEELADPIIKEAEIHVMAQAGTDNIQPAAGHEESLCNKKKLLGSDGYLLDYEESGE